MDNLVDEMIEAFSDCGDIDGSLIWKQEQGESADFSSWYVIGTGDHLNWQEHHIYNVGDSYNPGNHVFRQKMDDLVEEMAESEARLARDL